MATISHRPTSHPSDRSESATLLPFEAAALAPPRAPSLAPVRRLFALFLNPLAFASARPGTVGWLALLAVPALAFSLFFLQTGLDRLRAGTLTGFQVLIMAGMGAVYGAAGIVLLALVAWPLLRLLGARQPVPRVLQAFALAYSATLVYAALGLGANLLLGWPTAVAFGVTGVLWSMGPLLTALREMSGGRTGAAALVATVCGALLLLGWAWLSGGMT